MYDTIRKYCEWRYVNRRPDRSTQCTNYNVYSKSATNENIKSKAIKTISLSHLTMTHQICRLIFIEQLYRAFEIHKGSKYHK